MKEALQKIGKLGVTGENMSIEGAIFRNGEKNREMVARERKRVELVSLGEEKR